MANGQGLPRDERVRRKRDFERVFREGRRRRGRLVAVRWVANDLPHARLGIALSRAWRSAVRRNRAKRVVREAFRTHKDTLPKGIDLIVLPHTDWGDPKPDEVAAELVRLFAPRGEGMR